MSLVLALNFSFDELTDSAGHPELVEYNRGWVLEDEQRIASLTAVALLLQAVRDRFGAVAVHSAARSPRLNAAVGGRPDSQHLRCEAVDFHVPGVRLESVYRWIVEESGLRYGQCLLEGRGGQPPTWIHLSLGEPWRPASRSRQHSQIDADTNRRIAAG